MKAQAEEFGIGSTDHFIDDVERIVDQRRAETEWKNADAWKNGTAAFGARYLTPEMYLDYELKSIQLAFATYKGELVGNHKCHVYTEDEKRAFYDANQDLFTRYHGDLFSYEEVGIFVLRAGRGAAGGRIPAAVFARAAGKRGGPARGGRPRGRIL